MNDVVLNFPGKSSDAEIRTKIKNIPPIDTNTESVFIHDDNFRAMAGLLNAGYAGKIDLVYIDPPFNTGLKFGVSDDRVSTISKSRKSRAAYNDDMSLTDYLEFMRERIFLIHELLSEHGTFYLHIDTKVGHYLKILTDEIFGKNNFLNDVARVKSNPKNFHRRAYGNERDMVLVYSKIPGNNIWNDITMPLDENDKARMFKKIDKYGRRYNTVPCHAPGETVNGKTGEKWREMNPPAGRHWRTDPAELDRMDADGLIEWSKNGVPRIKKYADEHKGKKIQDVWRFIDPAYPKYPTEKNSEMLEMIIKQSSSPGSIVMDRFAGSGSTLIAAQKLGRRYIGIDQSDEAAKIISSKLES